MKIGIVNSICKSKQLKTGLEFVADYGALFKAGTCLTLATIARPLAIYSTPKTDKENKKLACAKSISSSAIGFGLMMGVSLPVTSSIKKIDKTPRKYLKNATIRSLKDTGKKLTESSGYKFATQLFKLGIDTISAVPKSLITCALIPFVMCAFTKKPTDNKNITEPKPIPSNNLPKKDLTFTGRLPKEPLTKGIAKILDTKFVQNISEKYKDTNYQMHLTASTDALSTATFAFQTAKSKKIKEDRKKPLINNAIISTGLSIVSGYGLDKALDRPTEKFIDKFKQINKGYKNLDKCVEGIRIAKPALLLGGIYYCVIPLISTFFAERVNNKGKA